MTNNAWTIPASGNRLLARLPAAQYERLLASLQPVTLDFEQVLYQVRRPIDYAYFPIKGVISLLTVMKDGARIEVGSIGNEGLLGLPMVFGADSFSSRAVVQSGGTALRMRADILRKEIGQDAGLRHLLLLYTNAFFNQVSQVVACNGLHTVQQRCSRWLLMLQERIRSLEFPLTHEFLAQMLGVRRATISDALRPLQEVGLIANRRGRLTILDRVRLEAASCECYQIVKQEYDRILG